MLVTLLNTIEVDTRHYISAGNYNSRYVCTTYYTFNMHYTTYQICNM